MALTVADVLALPVLTAGHPRVRVGGDGLSAPVRWVHISELTDVGELLRGGELVFSTGMRLRDADVEPTDYLRSLHAAGAVGLVVELGPTTASLPEGLVSAARRLRFPLVELTRPVRYVTVTEVVLGQLLDDQYEHLRFSERVHQTFAALSASAAPIGVVLDAVQEALEQSVVLEDLGHRALAVADGQRASAHLRETAPVPAVLVDWQHRSRTAASRSRSGSGDQGSWVTAAVGPVGDRWGRLVLPGPARDAARAHLVLQRASDALTVIRLMDHRSRDVTAEAASQLLRDLTRADPRREQDYQVRARALGVAPGRLLLPLAVRLPDDVDEDLVVGLVDRGCAASGHRALTGTLAGGVVGCLLPVGSTEEAARMAGSVVAQVERHVRPTGACATAVASTASTFAAAGEGLLEAADVATVASHLPAPGARVHRSADVGLRGLLWRLRDHPHLAAYVDEQLHALFGSSAPEAAAQDAALLRAHLDAGGSMTRTARSTGLHRASLYARVHRLQERLGVDLQDAGSRASLHVALLAHEQQQWARPDVRTHSRRPPRG